LVTKNSESSSGGVKSNGAVAAAIKVNDLESEVESSIGADREARSIHYKNQDQRFVQDSKSQSINDSQKSESLNLNSDKFSA
jgi:hypothetical protein